MITRTPPWAKGMQKIGPGCYVDANNSLHVSEREICDSMGVLYTEQNSRVIEETVQEVLREVFGKVPPATIIETKEPL
jgi:hypothetical protein